MQKPRIVCAALAIALCAVSGNALAQSTKPAQQPLYLPDPTPRPPDLEKQYGTDPAEIARQQKLALMRAAQNRQQILAATDKLLSLTAELKTDVAKRDGTGAMTSQATEAQQIEKLAKTIKEKTQGLY